MWKLYKQHGKLNSIIQRKDGTISQAMIKRLFGNFNDMLKEMGLDNNKIFKSSDNDLLAEVKELINRYGTINTNILHQHSKYAYQTYLNHFKAMQNLYDQLHIINPKMNYLALHIINIIAKILNTNNYTADRSNFNWLRHPVTKARLRLDAYFPEYNLAIEYDDKQHFEDINYFTKQLTNIQEYDRVKNQLCKQHNIKLLRIAYNDDLSEENLKKLIYDILENK